MTALPGWPAVSGAATFQHIRRALSGQVARDAAGNLRKGILPYTTTALVTGTATMNVAVAQFVAVLDRNGAIFLANDGTVNVLLSSAPASGSRWSVVYVKQRETDFADSVNGPIIDKVESTTSEAAARALLPAGALELAVVQVNAGSANTNAVGVTITQTYLYTAMNGGVVWLRNATEQNAWAPADGALAYRLDTATPIFRTAGVWKNVNSGLNLIKPTSVTGGTISGAGAITFTSQNLINIDGVFSSGFDNYVIEIDITGVSAITNLFARLRTGGTSATGTDYYAQQFFGASSSASAVAQPATGIWQITTTAANYHSLRVEIHKPADPAVRTSAIVDAISTDVSGAPTLGSHRGGYLHGATVAYDGFALSANGAITMSGTVRIYGYYNG